MVGIDSVIPLFSFHVITESHTHMTQVPTQEKMLESTTFSNPHWRHHQIFSRRSSFVLKKRSTGSTRNLSEITSNSWYWILQQTL